MVISDVDNMVAERFEAPTPEAIESQRKRQVEALINIRRLLEKTTRPLKCAAC